MGPDFDEKLIEAGGWNLWTGVKQNIFYFFYLYTLE